MEYIWSRQTKIKDTFRTIKNVFWEPQNIRTQKEWEVPFWKMQFIIKVWMDYKDRIYMSLVDLDTLDYQFNVYLKWSNPNETWRKYEEPNIYTNIIDKSDDIYSHLRWEYLAENGSEVIFKYIRLWEIKQLYIDKQLGPVYEWYFKSMKQWKISYLYPVRESEISTLALNY